MTRYELASAYWELSLVWRRGISKPGKNWTTGDAIEVARSLCCDSLLVGRLADALLDDIVKGVEHRNIIGHEAKIYSLRPKMLVNLSTSNEKVQSHVNA